MLRKGPPPGHFLFTARLQAFPARPPPVMEQPPLRAPTCSLSGPRGGEGGQAGRGRARRAGQQAESGRVLKPGLPEAGRGRHGNPPPVTSGTSGQCRHEVHHIALCLSLSTSIYLFLSLPHTRRHTLTHTQTNTQTSTQTHTHTKLFIW